MTEKNQSQLRDLRGQLTKFQQKQIRAERLLLNNPELTIDEAMRKANNDVETWRKNKDTRATHDCWHPFRRK